MVEARPLPKNKRKRAGGRGKASTYRLKKNGVNGKVVNREVEARPLPKNKRKRVGGRGKAST